MKRSKTRQELESDLERLQLRLEEADETLRAIQHNEVDALVIEGPQGQQIFTLQGSEQPYRILMECMSEGALTLALDGMILYSNGRFSEMSGVALNQIIGTSFYDFVVSHTGQSVEEMLNACGKGLTRGEFSLKTAHMKELPVSISARGVILGTIEGFFIVVTDLTSQKTIQKALEENRDILEMEVASRTFELTQANTALLKEMNERKQAEEKIAVAHRQIQNIIDNTPAIVYAFDLEKRFLIANTAIAELLGSTPHQLIGKRRDQFMPKEDADRHEANDRKVIEEGRSLVFEEHSQLQGRSITWLTTKFPLRDEKNRIYAASGISTDISERKRMEEELRVSRDGLEAKVRERTGELKLANDELKREIAEHKETQQKLVQSHKMEAIGTLAGGIAHDFNNILAGILGFTEMAIEDAGGKPQIQKSLSNILKSTKRARDLVKQIQSFSRKTNYQRSPISLIPIINETIQLLRASIPATIDIRFSATARSDIVVASPTEIQQIVMNLSTNAFMAMENEAGILEMSLVDSFNTAVSDENPSGECVQLTVKDTGVGMTPEVVQRAFDPFFTTREPGKGTGMGLAVIYGIVRSLNGEINVVSAPGKGAAFSVFLPKSKEQVKTEQNTASAARGGKETILYVEDEEMLNELGKTVLERLGYTVHAFCDSQEALRAFSQNPMSLDLVITDHAMPNMVGTKLASAILSLRADIPVILCTGYQEPIPPEKAAEIGITEILSKPVTRSELAASVRRVLDQKEVANKVSS